MANLVFREKMEFVDNQVNAVLLEKVAHLVQRDNQGS